MAKRKRTTALFDVIHKSRASSAAVKNRWWWPMGPRAAIKPAYRAIDRGLVSASAIAAVSATSSPPEPAPPVIPPTLAASSTTSSPASGFGRAATPQATSPGGSSAALSPLDVHVDHSCQRITMNFSYRSAIIVASSCLDGIVLAYIIGSHMSSGPAPVIAAGTSTAELRAGPAHPEALNVTAQPDGAAGSAASATMNPTGAAAASPGASSAAAPTTGPSPLYSFIDNPRVIGRQYVLVQSYPDRASADAAAKMLSSNNIPCTVETNVRGWTSWYSVVGQTGFDRIRGNIAFDHYLASIKLQSTQFAAGSKFKRFQPLAISWKAN